MEKSPLLDTKMEVTGLGEENRPPKRWGRTVAVLCIAVAIGLSHSIYCAYIFKNNHNFSYLSDLEREMSMSPEMGFYYSYYKLVTQDYPFSVGISKIMYDKLVEYPNDVNAFSRFNIYPEVLVGALYRYFEPWLNSSRFIECNTLTRPGLSEITSCDGFGVPIVFYLSSVWLLAGVTLGAVFTGAMTISDSIMGGLLAVFQYYANHQHATRVMWTPSERENFAWPLLVLQSWLVCMQLKDKKKEYTFLIQITIFFLNFLTLIFWQFTQFIYFTQLFVFFIMEQLRLISSKSFWVFLHAHFCGMHTAILVLNGNDMLKSSLYTSFFIVVSIYCLFFSKLKVKVESRMDFFVELWLVFLRVSIALCTTFYIKKLLGDITGGHDDSHIWDLLLSKFDNSYANFHTLLYTSSKAFDFLPMDTIYQLSGTTLIPIVLANIALVASYYIKKGLQKDVKTVKRHSMDVKDDDDSGIENNADTITKKLMKTKDLDAIDKKEDAKPETKDLWIEWIRHADIEPEIVYNVAQLCVYGLMAVLVMRLKPMFVTQLCILSGLLFKTKYYAHWGISWLKNDEWPMVFAVPTLCWLVLNVAIETLPSRDNPASQDPSLWSMLTWISELTSPNAVFAGSMPCMVSIMLSTRRPVVVHPHYENAEARARVYSVYKTYGRFSSQELYEDLTKLQVSFLVVEREYCYGTGKTNSSLSDIWDLERPDLADQPLLCDKLQQELVEHFFPMYANERYSVYMVHDYSVAYMPRFFGT